jgi:hypothetical protein
MNWLSLPKREPHPTQWSREQSARNTVLSRHREILASIPNLGCMDTLPKNDNEPTTGETFVSEDDSLVSLSEDDSRRFDTRVRSFNKKLALDISRKLGKAKPDISAAFVFHTLSTWRNSKTRWGSKRCRETGAVYRSFKQLQKELPWMNESTIKNAVERLDKALDEFEICHDGKKVNNYLISDWLIRNYCGKSMDNQLEKSVQISLNLQDAVEYGVTEAVLLRHIQFKINSLQCLYESNDDAYVEISASALSYIPEEGTSGQGLGIPILPFSRQEILRAIRSLKEQGVLVEHHETPRCYRRNIREA